MISFISFSMSIFNDYSLFVVILVILLILMIIIIDSMQSLNYGIMIMEMIMYDKVYDAQVKMILPQ